MSIDDTPKCQFNGIDPGTQQFTSVSGLVFIISYLQVYDNTCSTPSIFRGTKSPESEDPDSIPSEDWLLTARLVMTAISGIVVGPSPMETHAYLVDWLY